MRAFEYNSYRKAGGILLAWLIPKFEMITGCMGLKVTDSNKISHERRRVALQCYSLLLYYVGMLNGVAYQVCQEKRRRKSDEESDVDKKRNPV